jgi:predicted DNA-binding transcriptional regulator AlpA
MGRKVDVDNLVDAIEIAERLGLERTAVHNWRRRDTNFPQPVAQLRQTPVWDWTDVERWARATGRLRLR